MATLDCSAHIAQNSPVALLDDNLTFILRARVLKLYRQALRVAKRAPAPSKGSDVILLDLRGESVMVVSFDLQTFILRARVLKLYRQSLRVAKRAPAPSKGELVQTIRQEMENNRDCNDSQRIRYLISEGMERLKNLDEMLDMQGH
ncbi:hypothetical protein CTI12_AA183840 [Artemisia annua]|uniref:LYR motif-containing protein 2 n=1 Tax=Artemisia annua TaxID=35608 RepID=A0A2U1P7M0_ARTAN|nr:hypothetical protein CTI12_AA183840 [Artemisia annua]